MRLELIDFILLIGLTLTGTGVFLQYGLNASLVSIGIPLIILGIKGIYA